MEENVPEHAELINKFKAYISTFNKFNTVVIGSEEKPLGAPEYMLKIWVRWQLDRRECDKVRNLPYPLAVEMWNAMLMAFPLGLVEIDNPVLAPIPVEYQHDLPQVTPEWAEALFNRLWADGMWPTSQVKVDYVLTVMHETRPK